jgi:hypothetical protein
MDLENLAGFTTKHRPGETYLVYYENHSNPQAFYDDACCQFYLVRLLHCLRHLHLALHAYCITPAELGLLVTPGTPTGIVRMWHSLAAQYREYYGFRFDRDPGKLCSSFSSGRITSFEQTLNAQKYVERLPLARNLSQHPGTHRWSSYCSNAFGTGVSQLTCHRHFKSFLEQSGHGYSNYREFVAMPFTTRQLADLGIGDNTEQRTLQI